MSAQREDTRELPAFEARSLGTKKHAHALVIPVINEGERIRAQLRRIAEAAPRVDIVVADGGSTDGSLDDAVLRETGVRALLVKTGPGKLSAQLRMAYAWCLDEGYDGIVTIDGNGKDGVEAIDAFVARLEEGYDYVQGSRYKPGGAAVNTPFDREVAGRLIHAPLISLAGRAWYTDTTNGFRGYSRRYLLDSRVRPFRDAFDRYQLLFYLSVRAGQLGYRTCEIPVRRAYPAGEPAPTKVSGVKGRFAMLGELFAVVGGRYHPPA
ncbi:glycosyltransferase family 2 protein [Alsobacter sp. SYSU M60028]|uniref:Glycosyltransferase family 2 protein n=1 Tax=Alsobacter ponti TaxID=2962936 RepID=A0ABT1L6D5_9HYPH|nr:glycosyltransferase family 2 protein [Alsobacter ponti]MCP8936949.1 glycosyltransferase family 2 protein [Alsobacter ponti]